jgi:CHAT domain-containing protein/tetratricopeptide (TPR) repeat protein
MSAIDPCRMVIKLRYRVSFFFTAFLFLFTRADAQTPMGSDLLKFVFAFADHSQIAFDPIGRKGLMSYSVGQQRFLNANAAFESGDKEFYNGRYALARMGYDNGFKYYVPESEAKDPGVNMKTSIDVSKISKGISGIKESFVPMSDRIYATDLSGFVSEDFWTFTRGVNSYALLFQVRGNYTVADKLYNFALKIQGDHLGKTSEAYVCTLHNIAMLRKEQGRYNAAEDMLNYVIGFYEKVKGKSSREYLTVLNNKSMLDAALGRTKQAAKQLDEALALNPQGIFPAHGFDWERMLTNRALVAKEEGNLDQAIMFLEKATASMVAREKDDHTDYNDMVVLLGDLYLRNGNANAYMPTFEKALQKVKGRYGNDNVIYGNALGVLAEKNLREGKYTEARAHFQTIVSIRQNKLGIRHRDYLTALTRLAVCEWQLGEVATAEKYFNDAIESYFVLVDKFFPAMSETEKSSFWGTLKPQLELYHSFSVSQRKPELLKRSFDIQLKTKGLLLNNANQIRDAILNSGDSELVKKYNTWLAAKELLNTYYNTSREEIEEEGVSIATHEKWVNDLEKELSRRSTVFSNGYDTTRLSWDLIRQSLTGTEAAVEIIRVNHAFGEQKGKVDYVALLVKAQSESPELVTIGNGTELEKKYYAYYKNTIQNKIADQASYGRYWLPIRQSIAGLKSVYVSPDGIYNSININTLKNPQGKYVLDECDVIIVSNSKFITRKKAQNSIPSGEVMLVGDPAFGNDQLISPLPGTKVEVDLISNLLTKNAFVVKTFVRENAKEEIVKKVSNVSILHIATHGFFMDDIQHENSSFMGIQLSKAKENPLLRSGIMFSGAASVLSQEPIIERKDNGILTAFEAMNLKLQNTKLVVLSACETGKGEIVSGEGVYGLSRAFTVAGAQAVIISLWKVDDDATQQLMTAFYSELVTDGNTARAFMVAQKKIREKFPDPYYWGAFMLLEN